MMIQKIILPIVGIAFLTFGYLIYVQKRYGLINGFEADRQAGRKTEAYAQKVGLIEMVLGAVCVLAGVCVMLLA